jgi:hypothetical protein
MSIFSAIDEIITEHGSAKILRERLLLLKDQAELLLNENVKLKEELTSMKAKNSELHEKVATYAVSEEFVEYGMALFKRKSKGAYSDSLYCPRCKHTLSTSMFGNYRCKSCDHTSEIRTGMIPTAIADLATRDKAATD